MSSTTQARLRALVGAAAAGLGIGVPFLEKDFWVTEVLRAATQPRTVLDKSGTSHPVELIFKGGTSLSRVYRLVERFSEDVDLLVGFPDADLSTRARDTVLKDVSSEVQTHLELSDEDCVAAGSTTGVKRNIRFGYPASFPSHDIATGVLLEMGSRGGTNQPNDTRFAPWSPSTPSTG